MKQSPDQEVAVRLLALPGNEDKSLSLSINTYREGAALFLYKQEADHHWPGEGQEPNSSCSFEESPD